MKKAAKKEAGEYAEFAERIAKVLSAILPSRDEPYSYQEKADALGFSKSFTVAMLKGEQMPSSANIMNIAVRTGFKAEWLWTGQGPEKETIAEGFLYVGDLTPAQQEAVKQVLRSYKK